MPTQTEIERTIDGIAQVLDEHHDDVADDFYDLMRLVGAGDVTAIAACRAYAAEYDGEMADL